MSENTIFSLPDDSSVFDSKKFPMLTYTAITSSTEMNNIRGLWHRPVLGKKKLNPMTYHVNIIQIEGTKANFEMEYSSENEIYVLYKCIYYSVNVRFFNRKLFEEEKSLEIEYCIGLQTFVPSQVWKIGFEILEKYYFHIHDIINNKTVTTAQQ